MFNLTAPSSSPWNVPNAVTVVRFVLALASFVLIPLQHYFAALVVFSIAAATDWVDGYWARRYKQVTQLGRVLDPFVDKIIICGVFVYLAAEPGSGVPAWLAVLVMGREMLVTALRSAIEQGGGDFSAKWAGKWKMVFQCALAIISLLQLMQAKSLATNGFVDANGVLATAIRYGLPASLWLTVVFTVYSGAEYCFAATKTLKK